LTPKYNANTAQLASSLLQGAYAAPDAHAFVVRSKLDCMSRKLITIEHVFRIEGWGIGLAPVVVPQGDEVFRDGDPIDIKFLDGATVRTHVTSWAMFTPNPECGLNICIRHGFKREDFAVGAEVGAVDP